MTRVETFVFFDIETTGLPWEERNRTKITEASFIATSRREIRRTEFGGIPPVSKLTIMFNPQRPVNPVVVKMTGLDNKLLKYAPTFKEKFKSISSFLDNLPKPVCLLAHNGNTFDFKILLAECSDARVLLPKDILCADTLVGFRSLLKGTNINHFTLKPKPVLEEILMTDDEEEIDEEESGGEKDHEERDTTDEEPYLSEEGGSDSVYNEEDWPEIDFSLCDIIGDFTPISGAACDVTDNRKRVRQHKIEKKPPHHYKSNKKRQDVVREVFESKTICHNSFKLGSVYKRLLDRDPVNAHRAEADCLMLLECAVAFKDLIPWCEDNCKSIFDIKPLKRY